MPFRPKIVLSLLAVTLASAVSVFVIVAVGCSQSRREGGTPAAPESSGRETGGVGLGDGEPVRLKIVDPLDEALFPPDVVAPTFRWKDGTPSADAWRLVFQFSDGGEALEFRSRKTEWTAPDEAWEAIKERSREQEVRVTVSGVRGASPEQVLSQASVRISTSEDEVGAPLFFREVNLPFVTAVKDPAAHIRWRFGPISSREPPPVVFEKLPVCGNCHSFSADGSTLAMEVDSGNDKGGYAIAPLEKEMVLDNSKIISWNDYRKEDGKLTFGMLCQLSPDGRCVVGTVKDRALAVPRPDLTFSQLFFPVKGILAIYDRSAKTFAALPGADNPKYVQSNPTWSPDGKTIVFARCIAYEPKGVEQIKSVLVPRKFAKVFLEGGKKFRYDLYRIPFNEGKGGKAEPVEGASLNGMSNYFPKFSPDGKWIVFCKADSFMLLQPDSELYIIPAGGGQARRLRCNTSRMNSWHSWSPNGKWLVFSSKAYSTYTQLFLTHIDERGRSSVPVVLSRLTEPERAANIPEFVNAAPDTIQHITAAFLDDHNYFRAALEYVKDGDTAGAAVLFRKSLELNPNNAASRITLANILASDGKIEEAKAHLLKIIEFQPDHAEAHYGLAVLFQKQMRLREAADHCRQVLRLDPNHYDAHTTLGVVLLDSGKLEESVQPLVEALRLRPKNAFASYICGHALHRQGKLEETAGYYRRAVECDPEYVPALLGLASILFNDSRPGLYNIEEALTFAKKACDVTGHKDPGALEVLAGVYVASGRLDDAVTTTRNAMEVAREAGDRDSADRARRMLDVYEKLQADRQERSR